MPHYELTIKTIFGADYALLRTGINLGAITKLVSEYDRWVIRRDWESEFGSKIGIALGELLSFAVKGNHCCDLTRDAVIAAAYNLITTKGIRQTDGKLTAVR